MVGRISTKAGRTDASYKELSDEEFTETYKLKPADFEQMLTVLQEAISRNKLLTEKANGMSVDNMLLLTIEHLLRNYAIKDLGDKYGTHSTLTYKIIGWVVATLGRNRLSTKLPSRRGENLSVYLRQSVNKKRVKS